MAFRLKDTFLYSFAWVGAFDTVFCCGNFVVSLLKDLESQVVDLKFNELFVTFTSTYLEIFGHVHFGPNIRVPWSKLF